MKGPLQHHRNPYSDPGHPAHGMFEPVNLGDGDISADIYAVDTGPAECGVAHLCVLNGRIEFARGWVEPTNLAWLPNPGAVTLVEAIAPRGMPLDWHSLSTAFLAGYILGRHHEGNKTAMLTLRSWVLSHFGFNAKLKTSSDSVVRSGLIDRFGGGCGEKVAIGNKKNPGPLYGFKGDAWQALGIAIWYYEDVLGGNGPYGVKHE